MKKRFTYKKIVGKIIALKYALLKKNVTFYLGNHKYDLIIYDDIFPHPISGFRLEEYSVILNNFRNSKILLTPNAYPLVKTDKALHLSHVRKFVNQNPNLNKKIHVFKGLTNINTKLFYCIFINNIYQYIEVLEKFNIPFIFTLYPGGGFQMKDETSDLKLKRVLSSKMFKKVIVTQMVTKEYLINSNFCQENKIELIFGGVVPQNSLFKDDSKRSNYLVNKSTLDICFCAGKYMSQGKDKGYDVFIEVAHLFAQKYDFIKFHVIGGFDENDIDVSNLKDKITFYGYQNFENLQSIFQTMDIIISPNKSFVLNNGAFDGFPLGTVVEAALNGVLVLLSDDLNQNHTFNDNQELIIVESDPIFIEKILIDLIENPQKIKQIANNGKLKFQEVYSNNVQMAPRLELLRKAIEEAK